MIPFYFEKDDMLEACGLSSHDSTILENEIKEFNRGEPFDSSVLASTTRLTERLEAKARENDIIRRLICILATHLIINESEKLHEEEQS